MQKVGLETIFFFSGKGSRGKGDEKKEKNKEIPFSEFWQDCKTAEFARIKNKKRKKKEKERKKRIIYVKCGYVVCGWQAGE
jgi:hypothetical protein